MEQHQNPAFVNDNGLPIKLKESNEFTHQNGIPIDGEPIHDDPPPDKKAPARDLWGKEIEFLLSCIAMSVGLGNVWRFPFIAVDNGGGAFLIPYLIVLLLVGKPIYYLEMVIGQFSSRGAAKVYDFCPAMRGVGIGQVFSISAVTTYYVSIMALTLKYFVDSFRTILPWSVCNDEWVEECIPALKNYNNITTSTTKNESMLMISNLTNSETIITTGNSSKSSSELYFLNEVMHELDNITDGIGLPNWQLVIGLFVSWALIYIVIVRGVKSSGKASYFLAIFPYIVLGILLIRAVTLPGAGKGMLYFIQPQWDQLLNPQVWYAAVTQVFFSLSVCFGNIIMYSSYNKFGHNVYRDATIVTLLDTFTSLLAGFTIFGILGNLAYEKGVDDMRSVVKDGPSLAFISYPEAIAKFEFLPQAFSVLFFAMLFVLGIGSTIAMTSCTMTAIRDNFTKIPTWLCALVISIIGFCIGLCYVTPGGQFIVNLVDEFGATMICLILGIAELLCIGWIYGVDRICKDAEFMIGKNPSIYWRICWGIVTPLIMTVILIYKLALYTLPTYNKTVYPDWAYAIGFTITAVGILQVPLWALYAIKKQNGNTIWEKITGAFNPQVNWGPRDPHLLEQYKKMISLDNDNIFKNMGFWSSMKRNIFG